MNFLRKIARLFTRQDQVLYYIGGSDVLPAPLKGEDERDAIEALARGEESARQTLVEHNLRLVVYIARRFENTGTNLEDLISIGTIGLMKAIGTYRADRNIKLATYASRCIENEILMHIRKISNQKAEVSLDEPINQGLPLVADLGASAVRDDGQILAHLHLAHIQGVGQGCCGNIGRGCIRQTLQIGEITGKPLQNGFGNLRILFHMKLRSFFIDIFFIDYTISGSVLQGANPIKFIDTFISIFL